MGHVAAHLAVTHRYDLCRTHFSMQKYLWWHRHTLHGPNGSLMLLADGSSGLCPHCPQRTSKFSDSESLKAHNLCRVDRPFACSHCQLRFRCKRNMAVHERIVHDGIRFLCDDCGHFPNEMFTPATLLQTVQVGTLSSCCQIAEE